MPLFFLQEEQAMASWLDQHLSDVTSRYLQLEASGQHSGI
jgi:ferritin-like metal-binding protein YciE